MRLRDLASPFASGPLIPIQLLIIDIPVIAVSVICTAQAQHDDPYGFSFAPLFEFASVSGFIFLTGWVASHWYHGRK